LINIATVDIAAVFFLFVFLGCMLIEIAVVCCWRLIEADFIDIVVLCFFAQNCLIRERKEQ